MIKKCKMLYSDCLLGINEEILEYTRKIKLKPYHIDKIKHDNGHYTALVWYRTRLPTNNLVDVATQNK